ncbi:type IV pili methyl-accepting chemotaxis transducer N-terminal domain-containing protein [Leptolyngbya sp. 15MV]|nr:type IV pili methyl-accepting chemotaxis transducer N-terminal domain-containing protein [Leptolyngbya sp. 15MV]
MLTLSAQQRMLSQQLAKNFFFVLADVNTENARRELTASIAQFEETFNSMRMGEGPTNVPALANSPVGPMINEAFGFWTTLKPFYAAAAAGNPPAKNQWNTIATTNTQLLDTLTNINMTLAQAATNQTGNAAFAQTLGTVSTQRTLAHRLAADYTQVFLGIFPNSSQANLRDGASQFDASFQTLATFSSGNSSLNISALQNAWQSFKPTIATGFNAIPNLENVRAVARASGVFFDSVNLAFQQAQAIGNSSQLTNVPVTQGNE